ncbi:DUF3016 domain-containing protein [Undibacterium sp. CY18W]|uniref:DUF3016 domain-containing protein n=1 Tax=Undibacterium hunanense TaxID=2762292 RepID=A0ABR6ZS65_9BURK|nr:DUF3016 domain-containing protein [Undibacterium hunanense]MBC3918715.1 DUF3016 domain-containing protein [Undibacterium hunanense]
MKKICTVMLLAVVMTGPAYAGSARVSWQEPEKFTDIRPTNESKIGFQERVIKEFDRMFDDLAKKLPDGYVWDITVTDVDLAGDVRPFFTPMVSEVRVIRDLYWPRMSFRFDLKDEQGKTVASGNEDVKDMSFLMRLGVASGHNSFQYEEQMLRDWFSKQQKEKIFPVR